MTPEERTLADIKQLIEELPPNQKAMVNICAIAIRNLITEAGTAGQMALALIGAEQVAK